MKRAIALHALHAHSSRFETSPPLLITRYRPSGPDTFIVIVQVALRKTILAIKYKMGLSVSTHIEIIFCLLSVLYLRALSASESDAGRRKLVTPCVQTHTPLALNSGWDLDSPLASAIIPSITVSPAMSPVKDDASSLEKLNDHPESRAVSFAPRAIIVEDIEPPSTSSSDTFPSSEPKTHGRRPSDQIKIDSVLAQAADNAKHTLKSRPLTPFIKFNLDDEEEPLTAAVTAEFEVKDISSVVIGKSIEGGTTLDVKEEIESATFAKEEDTITQPLLSAKE